MVRDIQKILETIEDNEQKQAASNQQLIDALSTLTTTTKELGHNTGQTVMALDDKINVIKDFIVKQAEELTALKLRIIKIEENLLFRKEKWVKTSEAASQLGVSQWYLKQCRDCYEGGFFKRKEHYILGASKTAPIRWNINAVLNVFYQKGRLNDQNQQEYLPAEVYHADPAYSASDLKLITSTCPKVFYQSKYEQKKLEHEPALKKLLG